MAKENDGLLHDLIGVPQGGMGYWVHCADGLRLRVALWQPQEEAKGTVFIFQGRTEWIEKYGPAASECLKRGYHAIAIDWRGQGLSDRMLDDPMIGHVENFTDYQHDVRALIEFAKEKQLPKPWFMLAHSMGGAIGLRALIETEVFSAASFSAPMWGIGLSFVQRLVATALSPLIKATGRLNKLAPATTRQVYNELFPFEGNKLTADREMYEFMLEHLRAVPEFRIGGPSANWALEAIAENKWALQQVLPQVPIVCYLGDDEQIVSKTAIRAMMAKLPHAQLYEIKGARHEFPMEVPSVRNDFYEKSFALYDAHIS